MQLCLMSLKSLIFEKWIYLLLKYLDNLKCLVDVFVSMKLTLSRQGRNTSWCPEIRADHFCMKLTLSRRGRNISWCPEIRANHFWLFTFGIEILDISKPIPDKKKLIFWFKIILKYAIGRRKQGYNNWGFYGFSVTIYNKSMAFLLLYITNLWLFCYYI